LIFLKLRLTILLLARYFERYLTSFADGRSSREENNMKKLRNLLTEYQLIVDSTEQPTRPVDYEEQKKYYWQEKMHTLKNQFIVLPLGQDIVDVPVGELGKRVTLICFEQPKINLMLCKLFLETKLIKEN